MRQRSVDQAAEIRLFSIDEAAAYIGLGRTQARAYMDEIGATIKFGKRVVFDRQVIDEAISKKAMRIS